MVNFKLTKWKVIISIIIGGGISLIAIPRNIGAWSISHLMWALFLMIFSYLVGSLIQKKK